MRAPLPAASKWHRAAALALGAALAAGCTNLFHSDAKPEQIYVLRAPGAAAVPAGDAAAAATPAPSADLGAIQVLRPIAAPGLDSPHIILVQPDHRMNFYVGSRWPAPLPDVVEALAVETLRAAGEWQSVQDSASAFSPEYVLQISVRRFEADYTAGGAPQVEVVLDCTLGARQGRELAASFVAAGSAPAASDHMREVVAAFERASSTALASLEAQTASATRAWAARAGAAH
ncbi:MAG TPA: ABC-type transport auxiliary lipoprotein family protein [Steroidobacteraceae bacterium]|nr:ABC-type transport auxiliary lipoprotein family protein [Steroidobacteraceae bacterium]